VHLSTHALIEEMQCKEGLSRVSLTFFVHQCCLIYSTRTVCLINRTVVESWFPVLLTIEMRSMYQRAQAFWTRYLGWCLETTGDDHWEVLSLVSNSCSHDCKLAS